MAAVDYEHLYVKGLDSEIHLLTKGNPDGTPLLFLPGITSFSESFRQVIDLIPDEFYCLSMDMRGRGQTVGTGHRLNDYVADVLNVVNALSANPIAPVIVGHSMGARVAAAFASTYRGLLNGLVLVDPPVNGPGQRGKYPNPLEMFVYQKALVDDGELDKFRSLFPTFTEDQLQLRWAEYQNVSLEAIVESYRSFLYEPLQVFVKMIDCPALLLAAELGDTIRDEELAVLTRNPLVEPIRVAGVGHMIYKERPEWFAGQVVSFVHKLSERHKS